MHHTSVFIVTLRAGDAATQSIVYIVVRVCVCVCVRTRDKRKNY